MNHNIRRYKRPLLSGWINKEITKIYNNHHKYTDAVLKERMVISGGTDLSNPDEDVVRIKPHIGSPTDFEKIYYALRKSSKKLVL